MRDLIMQNLLDVNAIEEGKFTSRVECWATWERCWN